MKRYRQELNTVEWQGGVRDYWDGDLHQEHKAGGFFQDKHDIGFSFSTDGLQLFTVGQFSVWPLVLVNLNLPPSIRVKKCNLILCGIIPGPRSPKDIHSFLRPMIDELKQLELGIENVYDASTNSTFTLRAHLCMVTGDLPAIAKLMGISGHNSYQYCRFCECHGIHYGHVYCPLKSPYGWPDTPFTYNPADLPLRSDEEYRNAATNNLTHYYNPVPPSKPPYGVSQYSSLYELETIDFPRSFPIDIMHLIFENVVPKLFQWWTGTFLKKTEGNSDTESDSDDGENVEISLDKQIWMEIGRDLNISRQTIPTSYGRALRDISTYHKSFKAEEWCSFLLYYSPILLRERLLPDLYTNYMKLVSAIEIAIDYEITHQDVENVKRLLREFVCGYERLYYRYSMRRLPACLSTFHLLLHVAESISDCGPTWAYWQFPCERICGMLKSKVNSRVYANRNLSIGILHEEQFKHLSFASTFTISTVQKAPAAYVGQIGEETYSFFSPKQADQLSPTEASHLVSYYVTILECSRQEINVEFTADIVKYARCRLSDDVDTISSTWNESRRTMLASSRQSSAIRYTKYIVDDRGNTEEVARYGRVVYLFCHTFRQRTRMLAYVQTYNVFDHSVRTEDIPGGKVVEIRGEGRKEVICVSAIDAGIGVLNSGGKRYLVNRHPVLHNLDEET